MPQSGKHDSCIWGDDVVAGVSRAGTDEIRDVAIGRRIVERDAEGELPEMLFEPGARRWKRRVKRGSSA